MQIVPLAAIPSQIVRVGLSSQQTTLSIYQKAYGLFVDVSINDSPIVSGVIARDRVYIVRDAYLGFDGDLAFIDTMGIADASLRRDPDYTGLGGRFLLAWLSAADIAAQAAITAAAT